MTLSEFISANSEDLSGIMTSLSDSAKTIYSKLSRSGLIEESGSSGSTNAYGEDVQKLDSFADKLISGSLLKVPQVFAVGSEELENPLSSDSPDGRYIITYDPLDGSSNIDINLPIGTIFGIYPKDGSILQKGSGIVCSGYFLYGPSLMLVIAVNGTVNAFTFDPERNGFVLSMENIVIGSKKIYSSNEGNYTSLSGADQKYFDSIRSEGSYTLRYVGSMVGDIHRTLLKGGIFIYPRDSKHPEGKLRLLYEVAPLSFLIKASGGSAVSGGIDPLDIIPGKHDQRVPVAMGTKEEVEKYKSLTS